jgi:hypothetical protein
MTQENSISLTRCIRVDITQDPKERAEGPVGKLLEWIINENLTF